MKALDIVRAEFRRTCPPVRITQADIEAAAALNIEIETLAVIDWKKLNARYKALAWPTEPGEPDTLGLGELP